MNEVVSVANTLSIDALPQVMVEDLEWERETTYATRDLRAVFEHYEALLTQAGFVRMSFEEESGEMEARYANTERQISAELEVELKRRGVQAELSLEHDVRLIGEKGPATLTRFLGIDLPHYAGEIVDLEWELELEHPAGAAEEAFEHYERVLLVGGWEHVQQQGAPRSAGERVAVYSNGNVRLELRVEADGDVEIEFNKPRLYQ